MIKIAVMTENDDVWLNDVWAGTFSLLSKEGFILVGLIEPKKLSNHMGINIPLWYARTLVGRFFKLSLFTVTQMIRRRLSFDHSSSSLKILLRRQE